METCQDLILTWKIKNFSFCWRKFPEYISTEIFKVQPSGRSSWKFYLFPVHTKTRRNCISIYVKKCFSVPSCLTVGYELSLLGQDGSPLYFAEVHKATFKDGYDSVVLNLSVDMVFGEDRSTILPNDTLTIQCRMRAIEDSILEPGQCLIETDLEVRRRSFSWPIQRFSSLRECDKRTKFIMYAGNGTLCMSLNLYLKSKQDIEIEIIKLGPNLVKYCKCQFFLTGVSGKKLECGNFESLTQWKQTNENWKFPLTLCKAKPMENKSQYLPSDVLNLEFEIAFCVGKMSEKIIEGESGYSQSNQEKSYFISKEKCSYSVANSECLLSSKNDLLNLYKKGLFCDVELRVASESFAVHSLILSIRSSVFCEMLAPPEKERRIINIDDFDGDTVQKMIIFLYTDAVDDLEWECAKNLYSASNKYKILALKYISSTFLKQNLSTFNCCDILLSADRYEDDDLKQVVQNFIAGHDEEVIDSEQWSSLEENHPRLTTETFRFMHLKLRRNYVSFPLVEEGISKSCDVSEDCDPDECCVYNTYRKHGLGWCGKLQVEGEECTVRPMAMGRYLFRCRCIDGWTCRPTREGVVKGMLVQLDWKCVNLNITASH